MYGYNQMEVDELRNTANFARKFVVAEYFADYKHELHYEIKKN